MDDTAHALRAALSDRFGETFDIPDDTAGVDELARMAARRVCRRYQSRDVAPALLRLVCAAALSAPTKSDLQQGEILIVRDKAKRAALCDLVSDLPWLKEAPVFVVFLANGRRLPQIAAWRDKPFPNDHLDLFFNATVDAAIVLATFVRAAETVGLGCCPISVIRDHAAAVSRILGLPEKVVPVAGMAVGWPAEAGELSPRLPLSVTVHEDRYSEDYLAEQIDAYDKRRDGVRPYGKQREVERFGKAAFYGWSEDKARQYSKPQRADFGAFVRAQGFKLD
jgi:nitroreductase/FMN reductase [NAD(P)H]